MRRKQERNTGETALYERLSRDDENIGESNSIVHQKRMLEEYADQHGFTNCVHYTDDGWSGASFDRPSWNKLIDGVKDGRITTVIAKDLSRIGRDHLQVGFVTDVLFRDKEVRFIAIGNNIDSNDKESSEFAPFLNIMNEWYVRDSSRKVRAAIRARGTSGKAHTSCFPCYGYMADPADKDHWIIDEEAAAVVRRIFQLTIDGNGPMEIAKLLTKEEVERPSYHMGKSGIGNYQNKLDPEKKYLWNCTTVATILSRPEYWGCTVNFRMYNESYKDKKYKRAEKDDWVVFEGTQDPIIDKDMWDLAQKLRQTVHRTNDLGVANPLTGKVICADCGARMYNHRTQHSGKKIVYNLKGEKKIYSRAPEDWYCCSTYNGYEQSFGIKERCSCHRIGTKILENLVLETIKDTCAYVIEDEETFLSIVTSGQRKQRKEHIAAIQERVSRNERRKKEIDRLVRKIYDDNLSGKLNDAHFEKMLDDLEKEMEEVEKEIKRDCDEETKLSTEDDNTEKFLALVKKYTDFTELTPAMVNEFIDKILVHQATGHGSERKIDIEIYLNFIGKFDLPNNKEGKEGIESRRQNTRTGSKSQTYEKKHIEKCSEKREKIEEQERKQEDKDAI